MNWVFVVIKWWMCEANERGYHVPSHSYVHAVFATQQAAEKYIATRRPPKFDDGKPRYTYVWNRMKLREEGVGMTSEQAIAILKERTIHAVDKGGFKYHVMEYGPADEIAALIESQSRQISEAEGREAAMRDRFEKYVKENCRMIRHCVADGLGRPEDVEGKCGGYTSGPDNDEPHPTCQECIAAYDPDAEYRDTPTSALHQRLVDALREKDKALATAIERIPLIGAYGDAESDESQLIERLRVALRCDADLQGVQK